jgi:hypothetical protein
MPLTTMKRPAELLTSLWIACLLVACGPGTGGTGTGPNVGATLAEGTYTATLDPTLAPMQPLPCGDRCAGPLVLSVSDVRVELNLPCQRFVHEGSWEFDADGRAELPGRWTTLAVSGDKTVLQEQSVLLTVLANLPDGQGLRLELSLRGLDGAPLLGPVLVTQQPQQAPAVSCLSFN